MNGAPTGRHLAERLFERLLRLRGYTDFSYEPGREGAAKKPDYRVTIDGRDVHFEVKSFDEGEPDRAGAYFFDPIEPVRAKIAEAQKQFREFKDDPCVLVLYNAAGKLVYLTSPTHMFGAMYGTPAIEIPVGPGAKLSGQGRTVFTHGGKMNSGPGRTLQNTTFSAILSLTIYYRRRPRVDPPTPEDLNEIGAFVFHNPYARVRLPNTSFRGALDVVYDRLPGSEEEWGPVHWGGEVPEPRE